MDTIERERKITKMLKECILSDEDFILTDYKKGQKVYYLPKLNGFDNKKPLTISKIRIEQFDLFGNEYELPKYIYSFEGCSLCADEKDLTTTPIKWTNYDN